MAVVTELVIDGTGATRGAQEYERAMDTAQRAMQRGLGAMSQDVSRAKDGIASLGTAIAGLATGGVIAAAITAFAQISRELAGFEQTARRAGLALSEFQALRGAAALKGVAGTDFDSSIKKMATALNETRREETDLSRLLDINNIKFKEGTNLVIDANKALEIAANLIRRASSESDKLKVAKAFGISEELIPMLEGGADALRDLVNEARQSGAVLDDEIIQRAAAFDREWTRVTASWTLRIKAMVIDGVEELGKIAKQAQTTQIGGIPLLPQNMSFKAIQDDWNSFIDQLSGKWRGFLDLIESVPGMGGFKRELAELGPIITNLISDASRLRAATSALALPLPVPLPRDRPANAPGATLIPGSEPDKSAFDRQIESINRRVAAMKADAESVGLSAAAHEAFRTQLLLEEAAERDNIGLTNERLRQIADEVQKVREAAQARAQARVGAQIDFDRQTAFLSPQDVQIANRLKDLYGNDVPAALASSEASAMRFNIALQEINNSIRNAAASFATTFVQGILEGKSAMEAFGNAAKQAGNALISSGFQQITQGNIAVGGAMVGAGILGNLIGGSADKERKRQEQQRDAQQKLQERLDALRERQFMAGLDTSTQEGTLRQFDFQAAQQRKEAKSALGPASGLLGLFGVSQTPEQVELERALAAERTAIIKRFADQAIEQEKRRAEAVRDITESLEDRAFRAANDNSTLQGQLAEFDRDTLRERERLERDFAELLPQLDRTRLAEREALERDFNERTVAEEKRALQERTDLINRAAANIVTYVNGLLTGPESTLSPSQRLSQSQAVFRSQAALAQSGNTEAAAGITQFAENYRVALRDFFGSAAGYQAGLQEITSTLLALPVVQASTDPVVNALRDVLLSTQATTAAVETNNTLVTASNQIETQQKAVLDSQVALQTTANQLTDAIRSFAVNQVDQLTAIRGLQDTSKQLLELINFNFSAQTTSVTFPSTPTVPFQPPTPATTINVGGTAIQLLQKIVINTHDTVTNTGKLVASPAVGILHSGGWVPGSGDTNMTMQGGEFAIRREVARMNSAWLPAFNRTGQFPVANDNSAVLAELRALRRENAVMQQQIARLTHEVGEKVAGAIGGQTTELKAEQKQAALRGERDKAA